MKKFLVLALVLLLLVVGLPLSMGMGDMGPCPACSGPDAPLTMAMCLALLTMGLFIALALSGRISPRKSRTPFFLALASLERPPQHA